MKSRSVISITLLLLMLCIVPQHAFPKSVVRTVRAGFCKFQGYNDIDQHGLKSGYGYDFLNMVECYSNLRFQYIGYDKSWNDMMQMLRSGQIDVVTAAHKTPDREKEFAFSYPIGENSVIINVHSNDNRFKPYDYHHFQGITIGFVSSCSTNGSVYSYASAHGFSFKACNFATSEEQEKAFAEHRVDAIATNSLRRMNGEKTIARFNTQYIYAIVQKKDTALLEQINNAILQMDNVDQNWRNELYFKNYTSYNDDKVQFTPEELAYIKAHSTDQHPVILATDNNWEPFSVKQGNSFEGIIPDYWAEILEMTGMKYRYLDYDGDVFHAENLKKGKADIYLGTSLTPSEAEAKGLLVSKPFMTVGACLLYRKAQQTIHTIALCDLTSFLNRSFPKSQIWETKTFHSSDEALDALKDGEVDAIYCYTFDAQRIINNDHAGTLVYRSLPGIDIDLCAVIAINSDHTLLSIVSKCMYYLKGTDTEAIVAENLSYTADDFSFYDWIDVHPVLTIIFIILLGVIAFVIWEMRIRLHVRQEANKRQEDELTKISALNKELKDKQALLEDTQSEQKAQIDEITKLNAELEEQRKAASVAEQKAQSANSAKTTFLFNMSHDIRTPMNAIIGFTDLIIKNFEDKYKCQDYLQKMQESSNFLLSLINNVLEMARIESGKTELQEVACATTMPIDEVISVYSELMKQKNILLSKDIRFTTPYIYCDPVKLKEILLNLFSNAYKYTPDGGTVMILARQIPCQKAGYINNEVTVSDTGVGMSQEYLPKIFEEFSREHNSAGNNIQGTGLGMPIVKKLVKLMGGHIEVHSQLGKGTTFTVTIPFRIAKKAEIDSESTMPLDTEKFKGKRLLLAEDNDLNAEIAIALLSEFGFTIVRAVDGAECVKMLTESPLGYFDLILMDVQMPNMNGYEATRAIRALADPVRSAIPILAMTANAFDEDKKNAFAAGMNDHIAKPIDVQVLIKSLAKFIH